MFFENPPPQKKEKSFFFHTPWKLKHWIRCQNNANTSFWNLKRNVIDVVLVSLLLTFKRFCILCWLWTSKCWLGYYGIDLASFGWFWRAKLHLHDYFIVKKNSFKCFLLFFLSGITLDPEYNMLYIADSVGSLLPFFELT